LLCGGVVGVGGGGVVVLVIGMRLTFSDVICALIVFV